MARGPVEYVILEFPGGEAPLADLAPSLGRLVEGGTVRILDLVVVRRDADGRAFADEVDALSAAAAFEGIEGEIGGLIGVGDIDEIASAMAPGASALVIVWEDLWARDLADTVLGLGGEIVGGQRIAAQAVEAALLDLENATEEENQS